MAPVQNLMIESNAAHPLAIASDHAGLRTRRHLLQLLADWGVPTEDLGVDEERSVDYPDYASRLAAKVASGDFRAGVLICGTGIGMSIMANRYRGVRASLCTSAFMARMARAHNDANLLCLGERVIGLGEAEDILRAFLDQPFEGGRHQRRVDKLDSLAPGETGGAA
jgi:ribose 5-phosphate isomerase B